MNALQSKDEKIIGAISMFIQVLFGLSIFFFVWNIIVLSFNDAKDTAIGGIYLWPRKFSLDSYRVVFADKYLMSAFNISVLKTIIGVITHLTVTGIVAYGASKSNVVGKNLIIKMGVISMYFGGGLIPTYLLYKYLGLVDNFLVYIIPGMFSFYNMLIIMNFFKQIPVSLEESAKIDGASNLQILWKVYLPLSLPVLATIALFTGVGQWNDYITARIYITNRNLHPLQMYLYRVIVQSQVPKPPSSLGFVSPVTPKSLQLAAMVLTVTPILVVYPFLQKYFVAGMTMGAVKE